MSTTLRLGLSACLWIALGCGGNVVVDGGSARGGTGGSAGKGGSGGADGGGAGGSPADCKTADCSSDASSCDCETTCAGPKLRANCSLKGDDTVVCECHYSGSYMGTCAHGGGPICGLPGGCCSEYLK